MMKQENLKEHLCLNALTYLMFLKEKRSVAVKACRCADGIPHREFMGKIESSSSMYQSMISWQHT